MPISEEQRKRRKDKQDAVRREPRICGWCEEKADYPENNGQILWKTPENSRHMAICVKCYARLASEQVACVHCGKHVDGGDQVVCSACHDNQARELISCGRCNHQLDGVQVICNPCHDNLVNDLLECRVCGSQIKRNTLVCDYCHSSEEGQRGNTRGVP